MTDVPVPVGCNPVGRVEDFASVEPYRDIETSAVALFIARADGAIERLEVHDVGSPSAVLVADADAQLLAADAENVYWSRLDAQTKTATIWGSNLAAASAVQLATEPQFPTNMLAIDGRLYWTVGAPSPLEDGALKMIDADGGDTVVVRPVASFTLQLAGWQSVVFGVHGVWEPPGFASLFAVDLDGNDLAPPELGANGLGHVARTDQGWTWVDYFNQSLWKTPVSGGAATRVYDPTEFECSIGHVREMASDEDDVIIATENAVLRLGPIGDVTILALADALPSWVGVVDGAVVWHEVEAEFDGSEVVAVSSTLRRWRPE